MIERKGFGTFSPTTHHPQRPLAMMIRARSKVQLTCLLLVCLLFTGCSTKLTYNFLDWWMGWLVRDYVTLERDQRRQVKAAIDSFHRWHRSEQLPAYADALEQLRDTLSRPAVSSAQLEAHGIRMSEFWDAALDQLTAPAVALAASLSDKQIQQVYDNLEKKRLEYLEEYALPDPQERQEKRVDRTRDVLQSWLGRLDDKQKQLIEDWSKTIQPTAKLSGDLRQQWQEELKQVLPYRDQAQFLEENIERLMFYPEERWPQAYRDAIAHNQQRTFELVIQLNASLTDKQRQRRDKTFQRYIDDFRELAEK
ncbi:hypothetical protein FKG94_13610 [Exilibacterium tricleocarpae]|uniref:Lipoprotein n=1 Tax=Exilibacterium tricleocarpae TaxID=2591008 RepID=A0A545TLT3_9GAMM|nr:DUF6279 family lipoprotein [Exilibacterium tricleocarpae]TQV78111.1 hypothetical protein FKG94_13610 [Exilibacterium tricleocarpae]